MSHFDWKIDWEVYPMATFYLISMILTFLGNITILEAMALNFFFAGGLVCVEAGK